MLVVGSLFFWGLSQIRMPYISWIITFFSLCYLSAYLFRIISDSAARETGPPNWPEFTNWWDDLLRPLLLVGGTLAFCFWPAIVFAIVSYLKWGKIIFVAWLLLLPGLVYLPMALLAVTMHEFIYALRPKIVIPSIRKTQPYYFVACVMLAAVLAAGALAMYLVTAIPYVGLLVGIAIMLYLLMTGMHIVGLIFVAYESRLDWFVVDKFIAPPQS